MKVDTFHVKIKCWFSYTEHVALLTYYLASVLSFGSNCIFRAICCSFLLFSNLGLFGRFEMFGTELLDAITWLGQLVMWNGQHHTEVVRELETLQIILNQIIHYLNTYIYNKILLIAALMFRSMNWLVSKMSLDELGYNVHQILPNHYCT